MSSTNKTTNLELNDWLPNDTSKREDFNNDNYKIDEWAGKVNSQLKYEVAGGTATAITLNMPATLSDGYWKKFIASADNNGAATTINGKPFYKVCSTNPPNLKKDRPYEAYYNLTGDCFFLKASATGTTSADKVLAGETFSTENDTDLVGTMPQRGAPTAALNCGGTYNIQPGYYSGGKVTANSLASQTPANATAKDIISGKTAWVNGSKITGTATIESLGGKNYYEYTISDLRTAGLAYRESASSSSYGYYLNLSSLNIGFTPKIIIGYFTRASDNVILRRILSVIKTINSFTNMDAPTSPANSLSKLYYVYGTPQSAVLDWYSNVTLEFYS